MAHTYVVSEAKYTPGPSDPQVTIFGTVDGVAVTCQVWLSAIQQANRAGGITAVKNLVAPIMFAALPLPPPVASVELPTGTFIQ